MIRAKAKKDVAWKKESLEEQWGNNSVRYFHLALIFGQTKFLHVLSNCDTFTRFHCNRSDFPSSFHRAHKSTFLDFIQLFLFTVLISCFVCLMMCLHSKYIRSRMWFFVVFALFRLAHTHTWFNIEHINCECVVLVWCTRNTTPTTRTECVIKAKRRRKTMDFERKNLLLLFGWNVIRRVFAYHETISTKRKNK